MISIFAGDPVDNSDKINHLLVWPFKVTETGINQAKGDMIKFIVHFILLLQLVSCLPKASQSNRLDSNSTTDTTDDTTIVTHPYGVYWTSSQNFPTSIAINSDIDTAIYLRGTQIDKFLRNNLNYYVASNKLMTYCAVFNFSSVGAEKQLRIQAIPQQIIGLDGKSERRFRILFDNDKNTNFNSCQGDVSAATTALSAFSPKPVDFCADCALSFSSTKVELYASYSGISDQYKVSSSSVDLSPLSIVFDPSGNSTGEGTTCSDSQCKAINKDCPSAL